MFFSSCQLNRATLPRVAAGFLPLRHPSGGPRASLVPCMSVSALPGVCPGFCVRLPCPVRPGVWAPGVPADSERTPGRMQRNSNFSWRSFKTDRQTRVAAVGMVTGAAPLPWAPPQACGSAPGGGQKGTQQRRERTDGGLEAALQGLLCLSSAPLPPTGLLPCSPTHLPPSIPGS